MTPCAASGTCQLRSIGVHAYGGIPNEASVIGTTGSIFEDFVLAVDVRNGSASSARVKVSSSRGLSELPNFCTLTVYPPGTTASRQLTPKVRPQGSGNNAGVTSDQGLPSDVGQWTDDQLELILQQLIRRGLLESSFRSADGKNNKESEGGLSTFRDEDGLFESPKKVDDESAISSFTS